MSDTLDEIADMSPLAQAKILRAVEYGEFERVGGERLQRSNVRIISATNCSLRERIAAGKFREDIYHRLDGLVLLIPSLCDRQEDLPSLVAMELEAAAAEIGKRITSIHPAAMEILLNHTWPGNLRELYHTMRSVALFCDDKMVRSEHVSFHQDLSAERPVNDAKEAGEHDEAAHHFALDAIIREHVRRVYEMSDCNQRETARILRISRGKLARHLRGLAPN